jgi:hypothetical protein
MKNKDQTLLENIYDEIKFSGVPDKDISDLTQRISSVLNDHDTSEDIAKAIAQVIKNEYQTDVIRPFKQKLNEYLPDPVNEK